MELEIVRGERKREHLSGAATKYIHTAYVANMTQVLFAQKVRIRQGQAGVDPVEGHFKEKRDLKKTVKGMTNGEKEQFAGLVQYSHMYISVILQEVKVFVFLS